MHGNALQMKLVIRLARLDVKHLSRHRRLTHVTIRQACKIEARSIASTPASSAAVAVPGWSPIVRPSP